MAIRRWSIPRQAQKTLSTILAPFATTYPSLHAPWMLLLLDASIVCFPASVFDAKFDASLQLFLRYPKVLN
jgi:hypothetical protein